MYAIVVVTVVVVVVVPAEHFIAKPISTRCICIIIYRRHVPLSILTYISYLLVSFLFFVLNIFHCMSMWIYILLFRLSSTEAHNQIRNTGKFEWQSSEKSREKKNSKNNYFGTNNIAK